MTGTASRGQLEGARTTRNRRAAHRSRHRSGARPLAGSRCVRRLVASARSTFCQEPEARQTELPKRPTGDEQHGADRQSPPPRLRKKPLTDVASSRPCRFTKTSPRQRSPGSQIANVAASSWFQPLWFNSSSCLAVSVGRPKARITSGSLMPRSIAGRSRSSRGRRLTTPSHNVGSGTGSTIDDLFPQSPTVRWKSRWSRHTPAICR